MQLKTSDTFFPTNFRPTTANINQQSSGNNCKSYKLVKKRTSTQQSFGNTMPQSPNENIFKVAHTPDSFNCYKDRPLGGIEIFLKEHNKKAKRMSMQKVTNRIFSPEGRNKEGEGVEKVHFFYESKPANDESSIQDNSTPIKKQEMLKSHHLYAPPSSVLRTSSNRKTDFLEKSSDKLKSYKTLQHDNWVIKQTQNFHNKMSIVNEAYYKRPLAQKYGNRYFQFMLRNRHEQDFPPPSYVHQIKSQTQARTVNKDKFIETVKRYHPNLNKFEKLVLKGRRLTKTIVEDY